MSSIIGGESRNWYSGSEREITDSDTDEGIIHYPLVNPQTKCLLSKIITPNEKTLEREKNENENIDHVIKRSTPQKLEAARTASSSLDDVDTQIKGKISVLEEEIKSLKMLGRKMVDESRFDQDVQTIQKSGLLELKLGPIPKVDCHPDFLQLLLNTQGKNTDRPNKVLILDLDQTLIFSYPDHSFPHQVEQTKDLFHLTEEDHIPFILRPNAIQFLIEMKEIFYIVIFTAGESNYARQLLQKLELLAGQKIFSFFYSRSHLGMLEDMTYIKRLIQGIREEDLVIVDDCFLPWFHCLRNYIPIKPFIGDSTDNSLLFLAKYLEAVHSADDLRVANDAYLGLRDMYALRPDWC